MVLVTPDDRSEQTGLPSEVVMPRRARHRGRYELSAVPLRVSWSPDGAYLLYVARAYPDGQPKRSVVVAVPTDRDAPAVILAENTTQRLRRTMEMATQVWQR